MSKKAGHDMMKKSKQALEDLADEMDDEIEHTSNVTKFLAVVGFMALGAILVPAIYGMISAAPDLRRYLHMRRM